MLSPKWLARCTAPIAELYAQAESSILDDMARRISTYDFYIPAAQYQEEKLAMMGMTRQEIIAELSKRTGKTSQEIQAVMEAGAEETRNSDGAIYERAGKKVPEKISPQMRRIIRSGLKQTAGLFDNLTKATAKTATRQFEKALDLAWLQVSTGAMDPQSAARQAIKSLCKAGIQAIAYPTGHSDTLEVAVTRALRTGVNQTALKMQEQLADEMGSDLVEVTAHAGARPDHAKWQGKVYSLTGKTPGYQTLAKATGYGTGAGLGGWNCRHSFFPHFPGQSNTYSRDELEEYTRPDAVEYNGKSMSLYEAEQAQRNIERNIRRWKREDNALKAAGLDTAESSAKVRMWNSRYKDFCAKTGLKQQRQRTAVYTRITQNGVASIRGTGIIKAEERAREKALYQDTVIAPSISTPGYRRKIDQLGESTKASRSIWQCATKMLGRRSGTKYEDMAYIDSRSGKTLMQTECDMVSACVPTKRMKQMLKNSEPHTVVGLHNHPGNSVPSYADLQAAQLGRYKYGVIACHNGMVFKYVVKQDADLDFADLLLGNVQNAIFGGDEEKLAGALEGLKASGVKLEVIR